jgi:hypothetical protein
MKSTLGKRCYVKAQRWLSTKSPASMPSNNVLKRLIQPFVLKCHPDMAQQQGLPKSGQKVNLKAVQSLNSYIDSVEQLVKSNRYPFSSSDTVVEIEFVMAFTRGRGSISNSSNSNRSDITATTSTSANHSSSFSSSFSTTSTNKSSSSMGPKPILTTSRRKVELSVPPPTLTIKQTIRHVHYQILKLLKIANLPIPPVGVTYDDDDDIDDDDDQHGMSRRGEDLPPSQHRSRRLRRPQTPWQVSRQRFWNSIQWNKFDMVYREAWQDAQAHLLTRYKIRDTPRLRQQLLARLLSKVSFSDSVPPIERLVVYRRLLRLFDNNFDTLHLEDFGTFWEHHMAGWIVTEARPYNTSSSSMRKRRQKHLETGYSFTIHHNNLVTISIPIDFSDMELIYELSRNIIDFVEWTSSSNNNNKTNLMVWE